MCFNIFDKGTDTPVLLSVMLHCGEFFSFEEVYSMLCGVKLDKSPGPDNISARLLKAAAPTIARPLTNLFNMLMTQVCMPTVWKMANIKPIAENAGASEPKDVVIFP